jgi:hypothetical protein
MDSPQIPDSPAAFPESGKGHAAHWPLADIDDQFGEPVVVPLGVWADCQLFTFRNPHPAKAS